MDKNAIKKYAVWARTEMIDRVRQRAVRYEVTADANPNADSASGKVLADIEKTQRQAAIARMRDKGYEYVIEEVAYTWFNRFAALRYMEVNNYLPSRVRVFTDENGSFKPQILTEAIHLNLDGLDMEKVYTLKEAEDNDELYKYLLITQCNALSAVLPQMFKPVDEKCKQEKDDYTILLFPDNLLREGSVVEQMVTLISEDNWLDAVEIIGWLYQYYNIEPKAKVFDRPSTAKIKREEIPAATQLFTPDWIVRYMVENSLGHLWLNGHPNDALKAEWKNYLSEAKQSIGVESQLVQINKEYSGMKPENILCVDPCMGSGHIIVYMFDALMKIYAAYGYSTRESVQSIIEHNLYGLDIDDRAAQLAYFAIMMKAVQYDNHFLKRKDSDGNPDIPQPHVYAIKESNHLDSYAVEYFCKGDRELISSINSIAKEMRDASEYGSLIHVTDMNFDRMYARFEEIATEISIYKEVTLNELLPLVQVAQALSQKYDVVVTNPPYMGSRKGMNPTLKKFVEKNYPDSKSDMYTCFIEKCLDMAKSGKYVAMITQQSFMFTDDYKELREKLLRHQAFVNMVHLGADAFPEISGEVVQTVAFVIGKNYPHQFVGKFVRLVDYPCDEKPKYIHNNTLHFTASPDVFMNIKATPISYWLSDTMRKSFDIGIPFEDYGKPRAGITTGENDRFLRFWHEVNRNKIEIGSEGVEEFHKTKKLYIPYNKGGLQIKWYGNNDYVIMFDEINYERLANQGNHLPSRQYYCLECMTWSDISGRTFAARYCRKGFVFDVKGSCGFPSSENIWFTLAFLNSKLTPKYIDSLNPTTTTQVGDLKRIPIIAPSKEEKEQIDTLAKRCVELAKFDWDSSETSWDYLGSPIVCNMDTISSAYANWEKLCNKHRSLMKQTEEQINSIFIEAYNLSGEMDSIVPDKDIKLRVADASQDIKNLISYAVGCMFGRYSLDEDGLVYAGGEWDESKYKTFAVDRDGIIPICDDEYFDDDITGLFVKFVETVYGKDTLNENLNFIADALGGKGTPKEVIRNYFLNDFFADHCKMYQKRPIYWLFDSGKKNGFKALVYMHRYQPDTIARMRTDYVHEQQSRYRTAIADLENRIAGASTSERVRLTKQLSKLQDQSAEIHTYEEKIHHLADRMIAIDLDDGVKHNYEILKDVLAKIK